MKTFEPRLCNKKFLNAKKESCICKIPKGHKEPCWKHWINYNINWEDKTVSVDAETLSICADCCVDWTNSYKDQYDKFIKNNN